MKSLAPLVKLIGVACPVFALLGCGSSPPATSETTEADLPVSIRARLEYQADSLTNENRRLRQQVDVLATENRNLTAHTAELETRLKDAETAPKVEAAPAPPVSTDASYDRALTAFRKRDFAVAINMLQGLLDNNAHPELAGNYQYWIGESYYGMKRYKEAIDHFTEVLTAKTGAKKADAQLMIGNSLALIGDKAGARKAYNAVVSNYPASPLVQKAQDKLARLK